MTATERNIMTATEPNVEGELEITTHDGPIRCVGSGVACKATGSQHCYSRSEQVGTTAIKNRLAGSGQ